MSVWKKIEEELDVKKLHDPVEGAGEILDFVRETHAELKALSHFVQGKHPELAKALKACSEALAKMEVEAKKVESSNKVGEKLKAQKEASY